MNPQALLGAAAAAGVVIGFILGRALSGAGAAKKRAAELEAKLGDLESAPKQWEARIERYELLWFPTLTLDAKRRVATALAVGLPHCRSCVKPLSLNKGQWSCAECGHSSPESIADLMITDQIGKDAVKQFLQRNPGYTTALGRS